jgi:hypothetical protein
MRRNEEVLFADNQGDFFDSTAGLTVIEKRKALGVRVALLLVLIIQLLYVQNLDTS